jgi:hypothetical protein
MSQEFVKYNRCGDVFTIYAGIEASSNQMVVSTKNPFTMSPVLSRLRERKTSYAILEMAECCSGVARSF